MGEAVAIIGTREKGWQYPWWAERCVRRYVAKLLASDDVVVSGGASDVALIFTLEDNNGKALAGVAMSKTEVQDTIAKLQNAIKKIWGD